MVISCDIDTMVADVRGGRGGEGFYIAHALQRDYEESLINSLLRNYHK